MGWAHAVVFGAVVAFTARVEAGQSDVVLHARANDAREVRLTLSVLGPATSSNPDLFDRGAPSSPSGRARRGEGLLLGYRVAGASTEVHVRAGYRYGLPLDEPLPTEERALVLTSGGSIAVSAGTVAWLQLDLDGFREIAGKRIMRLDAVPGLRVRLGERSPLEAGIGCLAALEPTRSELLELKRLAAVVQLSGHF